MSPVPTPLHGIHPDRPNDNVDSRQSFSAPIDASSDMGFGVSFNPMSLNEMPELFPNPNVASPTQPPPEELPAAFATKGVINSGLAPVVSTPTYDPNAYSHFFTPFPFSTSPNLSHVSSTSPENVLPPSPDASRRIVPKRRRKPQEVYINRIAAFAARSRRIPPSRRIRGQNNGTRPQGTGFAEMMKKLPLDVQSALNTFYTGCCEPMASKDNCTRQKHMFSSTHCRNLPKEYLDLIPCYICPAYVALHRSCTTAKGGRYDSTKRHCKKCIGFREINNRCRVYPLEITKGEQEAMRIYRKNAKAGDEEKNERLVDSSVNKLLEMMVGPENFRILDAIQVPCSFGRRYY